MIVFQRRMRFTAFLLFALGCAAASPGRSLAAQAPADGFLSEPLSFQPNRGQDAPTIRYSSTGDGYSLSLTDRQVTLKLWADGEPGDAADSLQFKLRGSAPASEVFGSQPVSSSYAYYRGNNPGKWVHNVPAFERVNLRAVYPGIDLAFYGSGRELEYDFVVAPGGNPQRIAMTLDGARSITTAPDGSLQLRLRHGTLKIRRPVAYQEVDGDRIPVPAAFALHDGAIHFKLGDYNRAYPLVIDPSIAFVEYLDGGAGSPGTSRALAVSSTGVAYAVGYLGGDAFVKRFDASCLPGSSSCSRWFTAIFGGSGGGNADDKAKSIALDANGNPWVLGSTRSTNFPVTVGNLQSDTDGNLSDAFLMKLDSADLRILYATYFGGPSTDFGDSIAVTNCSGSVCDVVISGTTGSDLSVAFNKLFSLFPETGMQDGPNNAFVAKLTATANQLSWGSGSFGQYLGAVANKTSSATDSGRRSISIAAGGSTVVAAGAVYGTGSTATKTRARVWKLSPGRYLTDLHSVDDGFNSFANAVAVDDSGWLHVAGETSSSSFPFNCVSSSQFCQPFYNGTIGATSLDAFYAVLTPEGGIAYATFLGSPGSGGLDIEDTASSIAIEPGGNILIGGKAGDETFPHDGSPVPFAGTSNGFLAAFSENHNLISSTFIRPNATFGAHQGDAIGVFTNGNALVLGTSVGGDTPGPFVVKVDSPSGATAAFSTFTLSVDEAAASCPEDQPMAVSPCYVVPENPNIYPAPRIATITVRLTSALRSGTAVSLELLDENNNTIDQLHSPTYVETTAPLSISSDRKTWTFGVLLRVLPPPGVSNVRIRAAIGTEKCGTGDLRCFGAMTLIGVAGIRGVVFAQPISLTNANTVYQSPAKLIGGGTITGKVQLNTGALETRTVYLTSNNAAASVSSPVLINGSPEAPALESGTFTITTSPVNTVQSVAIIASMQAQAAPATAEGVGILNVLPDLRLSPLTAGLTLSATSGIVGGSSVTATVALADGLVVPDNAIYSTSGLPFSLVKLDGVQEIVIATGFIPRGQSTGSVTFAAELVTTATTFNLRARVIPSLETNGSVSRTVSMSVTTATPPRTVFGNMNVDVSVGLSWEEDRDTFKVRGEVALGQGSNGINPVTEPVEFRMGSYLVTIPAGAFELSRDRDGDGDLDHWGHHSVLQYRFRGSVAGTTLDFRIRAFGNNSYDFSVKGSRTDLNGFSRSQPVAVDLIIGNDEGRGTDTTPKIRGREMSVNVTVDYRNLNSQTFDVSSSFAAPEDETINPRTQDVALQIGAYVLTIPRNSFVQSCSQHLTTSQSGGFVAFDNNNRDDDDEGGADCSYTYSSNAGGNLLAIRIRDFGSHRWDLSAQGELADLQDIERGTPVTVSLTIGAFSTEGTDYSPRIR